MIKYLLSISFQVKYFCMKQTIQFRVYKGEKYYVGECLDFSIVTQGRKLDETLANIKEAAELHLEGEVSL